MSMTPPQDLSSLLNPHDTFPNLSDVILDTDIFTRSVDINDSYSLSQSSSHTPAGGGPPSHDFGAKTTNTTSLGEFLLPEISPSQPTSVAPHFPLAFTNWNFDTGSKVYHRGPASNEGLESIPEYDVSSHPSHLFYSSHHHLPSCSIPSSTPTSSNVYNISFPTTLQPREALNSKFLLKGDKGEGMTSYNGRRSGCSQPGDDCNRSTTQARSEESPLLEPEDPRSLKSNKRSRRSTPNGSTSSDMAEPSEDQDSYASEERRMRKKCFNSQPNFSSYGGSGLQSSSENRRRDSIKQGLDELQRVLPHLGAPEEEKISQASILFEAGKYIKDSQSVSSNMEDNIRGLKREIEKLNREIEHFQSELPENGVVLVPKVLASRSLADRFHDHVVEKTIEDWRYWVFTNIMGHFVHSFDREVDASSISTLKETNAQWISKNMSLHQLRKDAYRKLAKLCAKTSIVDDPSKLPDEALGFVTNRERVINTITETVPDKSSIER